MSLPEIRTTSRVCSSRTLLLAAVAGTLAAAGSTASASITSDPDFGLSISIGASSFYNPPFVDRCDPWWGSTYVRPYYSYPYYGYPRYSYPRHYYDWRFRGWYWPSSSIYISPPPVYVEPVAVVTDPCDPVVYVDPTPVYYAAPVYTYYPTYYPVLSSSWLNYSSCGGFSFGFSFGSYPFYSSYRYDRYDHWRDRYCRPEPICDPVPTPFGYNRRADHGPNFGRNHAPVAAVPSFASVPNPNARVAATGVFPTVFAPAGPITPAPDIRHADRSRVSTVIPAPAAPPTITPPMAVAPEARVGPMPKAITRSDAKPELVPPGVRAKAPDRGNPYAVAPTPAPSTTNTPKVVMLPGAGPSTAKPAAGGPSRTVIPAAKPSTPTVAIPAPKTADRSMPATTVTPRVSAPAPAISAPPARTISTPKIASDAPTRTVETPKASLPARTVAPTAAPRVIDAPKTTLAPAPTATPAGPKVSAPISMPASTAPRTIARPAAPTAAPGAAPTTIKAMPRGTTGNADARRAAPSGMTQRSAAPTTAPRPASPAPASRSIGPAPRSASPAAPMLPQRERSGKGK